MSSETLTASNGIQAQEAEEAEKVGVGAYISLFFAMCFFSGVFYKMPDAYRWLGAFDFTTLIGKFGSVSGAATFVGKGGLSARAGFLFCSISGSRRDVGFGTFGSSFPLRCFKSSPKVDDPAASSDPWCPGYHGFGSYY